MHSARRVSGATTQLLMSSIFAVAACRSPATSHALHHVVFKTRTHERENHGNDP